MISMFLRIWQQYQNHPQIYLNSPNSYRLQIHSTSHYSNHPTLIYQHSINPKIYSASQNPGTREFIQYQHHTSTTNDPPPPAVTDCTVYTHHLDRPLRAVTSATFYVRHEGGLRRIAMRLYGFSDNWDVSVWPPKGSKDPHAWHNVTVTKIGYNLTVSVGGMWGLCGEEWQGEWCGMFIGI